VGYVVSGTAGVIAGLSAVSRDSSKLDAAYDAVSAAIRAQALALVPKLSGRLASTLAASRGGTYATVTAGGGDVPYAGVQEYGWAGHGIAAQPYLRPAADAVTDEAVDDLARELQQQIDAAGLG
jgi:phage gpG-like protein